MPKTIREVLELFESYCDCEEYHIHGDEPEEGIKANSDPKDGHIDYDLDTALTDIAAILEGAKPQDKQQSLPLSPHIAWNQAIAEYSSRLKKVLGK